MRNPKLARLKARMTSEAFEKRRVDMAQKSTWRGEMETNTAKMFGTLNGLGQWLHKTHKTQTRINYVVGANAVGLVAVVGRVFGWW